MRNITVLALTATLCAACGPLRAADAPVVPADCFQVAESINAKLSALGGSGRERVEDAGAPPRTPQNPRHCFFRARELFGAVQRLREQKKLPTAALPDVPPGELEPADVRAVAQATLDALSGLEASFPGARPAPAAARVPGKTPADVYDALGEAQLSLARLGAPPAEPSDCYRMAQCVHAELDALRAARKVSTAVPAALPVNGKKPADCYREARGLLEDLSAVAVGELALPGGVPVPGPRAGDVRPGHVLGLLSRAAADASALKARAGGTAPLHLPERVAGKSPSDVFAEIVVLRGLARSLALR